MKRYKDNNDYPIERIPLDGSMRMMQKTDYITRLSWRPSVSRTVYMHKPTGKLFYSEGGVWYGTFPEYCYNHTTNEKGKWF